MPRQDRFGMWSRDGHGGNIDQKIIKNLSVLCNSEKTLMIFDPVPV